MYGYGYGGPAQTAAAATTLYTADIASYAAGSLPFSNTDPFVADAAAEQPTFIASGTNGDPCLEFDDTNDSLRSNTFAPIVAGHSFTISIDFELLSLASDGTLFHVGPTSGHGYLWIQPLATTGRIRISARTTANTQVAGGDLGVTGFGSNGFVANQRYVLSISLHDGVIDCWVDGVQVVSDYAFDLSGQDTVYATTNIGCRDLNGNNSYSPAHMRLYGMEVAPV